MKFRKGDLVMSIKGNLAIIVGGQLNRSDQHVMYFGVRQGW